ncbi:MAG: ABC transporter substrate-binding protein [Chloroflexi bacterium]|nr:ABC transporter substrate-binding protein [Chloroflexota bacterium]
MNREKFLTRPVLISVVASVILVLALAACGATATPAAQQPTKAPAAPAAPAATNAPAAPAANAKPATFVFCAQGDVVKLDPADIDDGISAATTEQIFETLVEFDGATTNVHPALAEKWTTSADGKEWTFSLRKGVKFHDGTPFNADAVLANYNKQWDPANPYHTKDYASLNWEYWNEVIGWGFKGGKDAVMKDIQKVDDNTVKFVLSSPDAAFLLNMALFSNGIVSPAAMDKYKTDIFKNPVGTGPFKFVEWVKDDHVTLEKYPDWWGASATPVKIDKVIRRAIKDNSARFLALKAGDCDGMEGANVDDAKAAKSDQNLQVILRPSLNIGYVNFNQKVKPLDNVKVRQAIGYAINRQAIIDAHFGGIGVLASQLIPQSLLGYNPDVKPLPYDPEKAKSLLKEAGAEKATIDLWYMPVSRPYYPNPKAIAESMAADLAKVGITANLKTEDWGQYKTDERDGKFAMSMLGWTGDNGDTGNFLLTFYTGASDITFTRLGYKNKTLEDLLSKAQGTIDTKAREDLYKQAGTIIFNDYSRMPVSHTTPPLLFSKKISGYVANPTATEFYKTVVKAP